MSYTVLFAPQALEQLDTIEDYIMLAGSPLKAARLLDNVATVYPTDTTATLN